ncbi:hypothetical protein NPN23_23665, partial [Vibrio parahaemolyticus]|nr:hypothetical protein [Vibrio parahaemolyticus]
TNTDEAKTPSPETKQPNNTPPKREDANKIIKPLINNDKTNQKLYPPQPPHTPPHNDKTTTKSEPLKNTFTSPTAHVQTLALLVQSYRQNR